ncbi:MAG: transposase [Planctomycetes bacterium]|nr:transposase [Planctomycetota bacterium]
MRRSKFSPEQIAAAVKQAEAGIPVADLARRLGVSENTFYRWRSKYGGLAPSEVRRLKELEEENSRLKEVVAELVLDKQILQDVLSKEA